MDGFLLNRNMVSIAKRCCRQIKTVIIKLPSLRRRRSTMKVHVFLACSQEKNPLKVKLAF